MRLLADNKTTNRRLDSINVSRVHEVLEYLMCGHIGHIYRILVYTEYP